MKDDTISRQAAIATAISGRVRTLPTTEDGENWIRVIEVRDSLLSLPPIQPEPRWIPVTERLPEKSGEYLVTYHPCYWDDVESGILVGIDTFRGKTTWAQRKYQRVIAWMPLPKPYERSEDDMG